LQYFQLFEIYFIDFLKLLSRSKKKIVIVGSFREDNDSLRRIYRRLAKNFKNKIKFNKKNLLSEIELIQKAVGKLEKGKILLLENLNSYKEESNLSSKLAKNIASLGDIYVIDNFSFYEENVSSVSLCPLYIKTVYSDSVRFYTEELDKFKKNLFPQKSILLLGGQVDVLHIDYLNSVLSSFDYILLGNNWATYLWKHKKKPSKGKVEVKLLAWMKRNHSKLIFPLDLIIVRKDKKTKYYASALIKPNKLKNTDIVIDLGPETIRYYALLIREAKELLYDNLLSPIQGNKVNNSDLILARMMANRSRGKAYGVILGTNILGNPYRGFLLANNYGLDFVQLLNH
jgi:phosphoglycerate kinase